MYDRDWARDGESDARFWRSWPRPVRWLVGLIVVLIVVGVAIRNYRDDVYGLGDFEQPSELMMAMARGDADRVVAILEDDPGFALRPLGPYAGAGSAFDYAMTMGNAEVIAAFVAAGGLAA